MYVMYMYDYTSDTFVYQLSSSQFPILRIYTHVTNIFESLYTCIDLTFVRDYWWSSGHPNIFFLHSLWCPFPPNRRRSTISKTKAPLSQATTAVSRCVTDEAHSGHLNIFHLDSRRRRESLSGLNVSCCY